MLLNFKQKSEGGTYYMLNICSKCIILSRDVACLKNKYKKYISRWEQTKANSYIIQCEDNSNKCSHIGIDPTNTENFNMDKNIKTGKDHRWEEDTENIQNTTMTVSLKRQGKKEKDSRNHEKYINKNVIRALKNGYVI